MSEQSTAVREELKSLSKDDFLKKYSRKDLNAIAGELGVEEPSKLGNKDEVFDAIVKAADLPDPTLRGNSTVEAPVAQVWAIADKMFADARKAKADKPRRKDVIEACMAAGIAFYTARTQYQLWYSHTSKGEKLIADGNTDGLPKSVAHLGEKK